MQLTKLNLRNHVVAVSCISEFLVLFFVSRAFFFFLLLLPAVVRCFVPPCVLVLSFLLAVFGLALLLLLRARGLQLLGYAALRY
jgi:hypothetical protein